MTGGYGASRVKMHGGWRSAGAHQIAHYVKTGRWERQAEGRVVRHLCHNPPCCNPDHLVGGSHQDNSDDQVARRLGIRLTPLRPLVLPVTGVAYDWCPGMMTVDGRPHDVHRLATEFYKLMRERAA